MKLNQIYNMSWNLWIQLCKFNPLSDLIRQILIHKCCSSVANFHKFRQQWVVTTENGMFKWLTNARRLELEPCGCRFISSTILGDDSHLVCRASIKVCENHLFLEVLVRRTQPLIVTYIHHVICRIHPLLAVIRVSHHIIHLLSDSDDEYSVTITTVLVGPGLGSRPLWSDVDLSWSL